MSDNADIRIGKYIRMAILNTDHEPSTFFHASFDSVYLARVLKLTSLENSLHIKINSQSNRRHASQVQFASNSFSPKQFFITF